MKDLSFENYKLKGWLWYYSTYCLGHILIFLYFFRVCLSVCPEVSNLLCFLSIHLSLSLLFSLHCLPFFSVRFSFRLFYLFLSTHLCPSLHL